MAEAINHSNITGALKPTLCPAGVLGLDIVDILLSIWIHRKTAAHEASSVISYLRINTLYL